jgi:ribosomal protein S18 acetylase RimI-like enzyme
LHLVDGTELTLRPLTAIDVAALADFLAALSPESRRLSSFVGYDESTAQELCDAIGRYDKLRFVVTTCSGLIVGLLEFSLSITPTDQARYRLAGITIDATTDCRFGPTLADDYQDRGLGSTLWPVVVQLTQLIGRSRILLWGGVLADNARAIHYYTKHGFHYVGEFVDQTGNTSLDMMLDLDH